MNCDRLIDRKMYVCCSLLVGVVRVRRLQFERSERQAKLIVCRLPLIDSRGWQHAARFSAEWAPHR